LSASRLPIDPLLPQVIDALRTGSSLVVEAPPGAGKTTRVPRALLEAQICGDQEILVLQPRRLPTRLAAARVAEELGEPVGQRVGYAVRFEEVGGPRTRLRFITEGILIRRLVADPSLRGVGCVILDEFHERHLSSDLGLALLRRLQREERPELKIVVMSATLAGEAVASFLGGAPRLRSEGRTFPLSIEHRDRPDDRPLPLQVAGAVKRMLQEELDGHLLVFLPGAAQIRRSAEALEQVAASQDLLVLPLHGDLPAAEQDRAVASSERRKVILSTNVAETSVTIDGIAAVIDTGLARIAGHSPWSGLPTLETARVSQASATQRAGRAGRTRAGRVLRLYSRHDYLSSPEHDLPEIHRLDLAELLLELRGVGVSDPAAFEWFEAPPPQALQAGEELLLRLGAIGADGALTALGRRLLALPIHPRLGRLVAEGEARGVGADACVIAALTAERDIRRSARTELGAGRGHPQAARRGAAGHASASDLLTLLELFREAEASRFSPQRLRSLGLDPRAVEAVDRSRRQLERRAGAETAAWSGATLDGAAKNERQGRKNSRQVGEADPAAREEALLISILSAFPDRVARRRNLKSRDLVLSGGGSAQLSDESAVHDALFLIAVEAEERAAQGAASRTGLIRLASAIEPEWLLDLFPERIRESEEWVWNEGGERVERISSLRYGAVVIDEDRGPARPSPETARVLARAAAAKGIDAFADRRQIEGLLERIRLGREALPEAALPALSPEDLEPALISICEGARSFADLRERSLLERLLDQLSPRQRQLLDRELPQSLRLPGGKSVPIHYEPGRPPWIESRLQDFFGMTRGPTVAGGRIPLTLHLLAPNMRAVQVTSDLAGFWERHYPALRKELGRRYPKHAWPEDGRTAKPPAGGRIR